MISIPGSYNDFDSDVSKQIGLSNGSGAPGQADVVGSRQ